MYIIWSLCRKFIFFFFCILYMCVWTVREVNRFCRLDVLHIFLHVKCTSDFTAVLCRYVWFFSSSSIFLFFYLKIYIKDPLNLIRVLQTCRLRSYSYLFQKNFGCCVIYIKFTYKVDLLTYNNTSKMCRVCSIFRFFFCFNISLHIIFCDKNFELKKKLFTNQQQTKYNPTKSSKSQAKPNHLF